MWNEAEYLERFDISLYFIGEWRIECDGQVDNLIKFILRWNQIQPKNLYGDFLWKYE